MAIRPCRECQHDVSTEATACPNCGAPDPAAGPGSRATRGGTGFEWKSGATFLGLPWIHVATGRTAEGKRRVAKGIIAVGQYGLGIVTIAQFGAGLVFGFGQFIAAPVSIAQFAAGVFFGLGQFATGEIGIGQFAFGAYVLAQIGFGRHVWSVRRKDPEAIEYFTSLGQDLGLF